MTKTLALLLALVTVLGLLAGCAKDPAKDPVSDPSKDPVNPDPNKPAEPFVYYWVRSNDDVTLNPHDASTTGSSDVVNKLAGKLFFLKDLAGPLEAECN